MKTPDEMYEELKEKEIHIEVERSFPDSIDPAWLLSNPLEALIMDEETGYIERRRVGAGWRPIV